MTLRVDEVELLRRHLPYELEMLRFAYVVATSAAGPSDRPIRDLYRLLAIDAFYLHARNLIEFYEGTLTEHQGQRTTRASTFTRSSVTYPTFGDFMELINNQVSHINYERGEQATDPLDGRTLTNIKGKLDECLELFQNNLTKEAHAEWSSRRRDKLHGPDPAAAACNEIYAILSTHADIGTLIEEEFLRLNVDLSGYCDLVVDQNAK